MTRPSSTALDRYIGLADQAIADPAALEQLIGVFAPDAVVQLDDTPITGQSAIADFYREFASNFVESKHFWNTTVLGDGTLKATWVCAARTAGGAVVTVAGVEHARVNQDGLIVDLRNEYTRRPG